MGIVKGDAMDKTVLENYLDSLFQNETNNSDPDAFVGDADNLVDELGSDVLLLEKNDLLRILFKCLRALDMEKDYSTNSILAIQNHAEAIIIGMEKSSAETIEKFKVLVKAEVDDEINAITNTVKMDMARKGAASRHTETYALRDKIIAYWRDNIGADKSNEFAAELLQKEFPEVAHRTLVSYISKAKKLPPAGTL